MAQQETATISGTVTMTDAAMIEPQGTSYAVAPVISEMLTGTVRCWSSLTKVSANRNSFQFWRNRKIAMVARAGRVSSIKYFGPVN